MTGEWSRFAGVDAGGSHSEIVLIDRERQVIARATGGPGALRPGNAPSVVQVIAKLVAEATEPDNRRADVLVVAAAGAGRKEERDALENALRDAGVAGTVAVVTDGEAALESAFGSGPGFLLIAGTGSIAYARDLRGGVHRVGGLGWQLGDEGSGYALGRAALSVAGKSAEGRGPSTALLPAILGATGAADLDALVRWSATASRTDVAGLATVVSGTATAGDAIAREIIEQGAEDLAAHVIGLMRRLGDSAPDIIAFSGGVLAARSPARISLVNTLARRAPALRISSAVVDPAYGAALIALRT